MLDLLGSILALAALLSYSKSAQIALLACVWSVWLLLDTLAACLCWLEGCAWHEWLAWLAAVGGLARIRPLSL